MNPAIATDLSTKLQQQASVLGDVARLANTPELFARFTYDIGYTLRSLMNALDSAVSGLVEGDTPCDRPFVGDRCWPVMIEGSKGTDEAMCDIEEWAGDTAQKLEDVAEEVFHLHFMAHGWLDACSSVASPTALDLGAIEVLVDAVDQAGAAAIVGGE